jgi:hypothetical protein
MVRADFRRRSSVQEMEAHMLMLRDLCCTRRPRDF